MNYLVMGSAYSKKFDVIFFACKGELRLIRFMENESLFEDFNFACYGVVLIPSLHCSWSFCNFPLSLMSYILVSNYTLLLHFITTSAFII